MEQQVSSSGDLFKLSNDEQRMVYGYLTTEEVDSHGDIVTVDALQKAFEDYWGNIREMHQPSAAGVVKEHGVDDKGFWIGAYIGDDQAWHKVKEEIYKGFSIRGPCLGRDPMDRRRVTACKLKEISLVDRGANNLRFELVKLDDHEETQVAENALKLNIDTEELDEKLKHGDELVKLLTDPDLDKKLADAREVLSKLDDAKPADEDKEELLSKLADATKANEELSGKVEAGEKAGEELLSKLGEQADTIKGLTERLVKLEDAPRGVEPAAGAASGSVDKDDDALTGVERLEKLGDKATALDVIEAIHQTPGQGPLPSA